VIPESGYLVENRLTLADISVASPFANLQHINVALDPARHPKTLAYVGKILARPSFAPMIEQETRFLERTAG
jgi:glutathione S-transferase